MSGSSNPSSGRQGSQPRLSDYITHECPVCGRPYDKEHAPCHPASATETQRQFVTREWLLFSQRPPNDFGPYAVGGSDNVTFECLYPMLRSLIDDKAERVEDYITELPFQIPNQEWVAKIYNLDLRVTDEAVGILAAIRGCETRVEQVNGDLIPSNVFAHLVYLDQYGLIPGYRSLSSRGNLREVCAEHYNVEVEELRSKWIVERRVDRSKVFSTTEQFQQEWNLEFGGGEPNTHPHAEYKPFDGTAVLGDHRDHNLVTKKAKQDLLSRPDVDWSTAPHSFYSRSGYGTVDDPGSNKLPVLSFDFAGFETALNGPKLRYLGIVTDHEEDPFEVYLQIVQISKTNANGIVIMPNRDSIYEFLDFLKETELVSETEFFLDSVRDYHSIPNVRSLHNQVVQHIELLHGTALLPRRKLMDEGFRNIGELISVPTYA